ncbi:hypothetical protein F4778DRAFT_734800 [Xylariomycetidae sp. FL2044]|nr:hypothetical protein F4778DRAFT_734800 [Xylariomycetidae sp. FL2044]
MVTTRSSRKSVAPGALSSSSSSDVATSTSPSPSSSPHLLWSHTPTRLTLLWFAISLPLVIWDTGYVLLRPLTMEGGSLHWPLWVPYRLYGEVDHVYGWKAFNAGSGFTSAQGFLNAVETAMYLFYVAVYFRDGVARAPSAAARTLSGKPAALAVLVAFSAAVMTVSKTALYWLQEYFSGYDNIGHNSMQDLIILWIIPNGPWLVLPTYMIYVMGGEIVEGLSRAASATVKSE